MRVNQSIFRSCIFCDSDQHEPVFSFTHEYLTVVLGISPLYLQEIGWSEKTTSSIVRCSDCGVRYVRDVFLDFEESKPEMSEEDAVRLWDNHDSHKKFVWREFSVWILHNLISRAIEDFSRNLRLLDYGAGAGSTCNLARALGIKDVYAYEPFSPYHPKLYTRFNFPGITVSRNWEEIEKEGPFDVVICNSVFEHLSTPGEDIARIHGAMNKGGYFYINNPFDGCDFDREIDDLKKAKKVVKQMPISHYHPGHLNYLTRGEFERFMKRYDFEFVNIGVNLLVSQGDFIKFIKRVVKSFLVLLSLRKPDVTIFRKI